MRMDAETIAEAMPYMTAVERLEYDAIIKSLDHGEATRVIAEHLFELQRNLANDPHRFVTACCGRRGGKTEAVAGRMLDAACSNPKRTVIYATLTKENARVIIWPRLKELNSLFDLRGKPSESNLTMEMPNGAVIMLVGIDNRKQIEKRRGFGIALFVLDECQSIPEYVRRLIDDVVAPALADVRGQLVMIGTPSMLTAGYWFECHHNRSPLWGHHAWTILDNPTIPDAQKTIDEECERRGVPITDASIQREWFARWVRDASSAVFTFDAEKNTYLTLPRELDAQLYRYVISIDLGGGVARDNDAIGAFAFHPHSRATWLIEEQLAPKDDVTAVSLKVAALNKQLGGFERVVAIVCDTGGIGAKVALEMSRRHKLSVEAANKKDKWANIEVLNAACNRREFFAKKDSAFALAAVKVEKDWEKSTPDKIEIKGHMPDVCDMTLYGYVECQAWLSKIPEDKPRPGSKEWAEEQQRLMFAKTMRQVQQQKMHNGADDWGGEMDDFGGGIEWSA